MQNLVIGSKDNVAYLNVSKMCGYVAQTRCFPTIESTDTCKVVEHDGKLTCVAVSGGQTVYLTVPADVIQIGDAYAVSSVCKDDTVYVQSTVNLYDVALAVYAVKELEHFTLSFDRKVFTELFPNMQLIGSDKFTQVGSFEQGGPKCPKCGYVGNAYTFNGRCANCSYGVAAPEPSKGYIDADKLKVGNEVEYEGMDYVVSEIAVPPKFKTVLRRNGDNIKVRDKRFIVRRW